MPVFGKTWWCTGRVLAFTTLLLACAPGPTASRRSRVSETDAEEPSGAAVVEVDFESDAVAPTPAPALGGWARVGLAALVLAAGWRLRSAAGASRLRPCPGGGSSS